MTEIEIIEPNSERGIALITALLATMLLLALGLAVVRSTTSDTTTTKVQRVGEQSFFIADAGIGIARRAITQAFAEEIDKIRTGQRSFYSRGSTVSGQFPTVQVTPPPDGTWNNSFYQSVRDRAIQLATATSRAQRLNQLNGSSFSVTYQPPTGTVSLVPTSATSAVEVVVLRYTIQVTGKNSGGGSAAVNETGRISFNINLTTGGGDPTRSFKFSGFAAFFDDGDTNANAALAAGTFTGPVHTNTHFSFFSSRNVVFRNIVSQVEDKIRYDSTSSTAANLAIPKTDITGIDISSEGYKKVNVVPLPDNNFSQEYAVINNTGITDKKADGTPVDPPAILPKSLLGALLPIFDLSGRVSVDALVANLRTNQNTVPLKIGSLLTNGVYISSADGVNINGAGIYVQGDASDIQLYADTNGDQVYVITQGTTATTVRTNFTGNKTIVTSGSKTTTYNGVFTDKSTPTSPKPGAILFVNGSINSLRGGKSGSTTKAAVASSTALTITAQRNITITGDLKYANPVANSDGTPVTNISSIKNVLGIFTNDGNVNLAPNTSYVAGPGLSLEMDAAVIAFNKNTGNDAGEIEGSIVYNGSTAPDSSDRWKLVGSRVQSKINNISYSQRDIFFDTRFSGGTFAPPFFPGTTYTIATAPDSGEVAISTVDAPASTAMSWFRDNN